jgi:hypothetical protein
MGSFEHRLRERIAEAEGDAGAWRGSALSRVRSLDAEALRCILRAWEASLTPAARLAAARGLPTGPFDGGWL